MTPHILIIDDQISLPRFIAIELEAIGYQVSVRDMAKLSTIQAINPDLIILNWELRSASGLNICRQLNRLENPTPLLVTTVKSDNCQTALNEGAQACLTKPFSIEELINSIQHYLESQKGYRYCANKYTHSDSLYY